MKTDKAYGVRYSDGSWLRSDGYATKPGQVNRAWSGNKLAAQRLVKLFVVGSFMTGELVTGSPHIHKLPIAKETER